MMFTTTQGQRRDECISGRKTKSCPCASAEKEEGKVREDVTAEGCSHLVLNQHAAGIKLDIVCLSLYIRP